MELNDLMIMPTRDVLQLHVRLRTNADASNIYVQWFLNHSQLPIIVQMGQEWQLNEQNRLANKEQEQDQDLEPEQNPDNRLNIAMVTSLTEFISTPMPTSRAGIYFNILEETGADLSPNELMLLEQSCRLQWTQHKIYNRYILTTYGIWFYDPFGRIDNGFGRLVSYAGDEILPTLLFHDMRGYPLRVQMFKSVYARPEIDKETGLLVRVTGLDWLVAQMLQERLNFTMVLQQPDKNYFGERSANGSYNGAIGSIIRDGLDICLTGFFVKDYLVQQFMDFTVAVYDDELCIYVPKASRIPQSILPIFAVGYDIWLGFILSAFVCALIWLVLRIINLQLNIVRVHGKRLFQQALAIVVDTWVVWVRVNLSQLPESYAERMFIGSLCLVSVIFGAIFESSLATVYIHPLHYRDIVTLQDLDDSGLKVVYKYTSMADDLFFSETSPLYASLNKKLSWNRDLHADVIDDVARHGGKAGVSRYLSLMLESSHYMLMRRIWIVPECPKYYTISYVMPRDAPWEDAINALLLRLLSAGIIAKWIKDQKSQVDIEMRGKMTEADADDNVVRVLTIEDLQLAFYVVVCGNLFGLLGFLLEHAWQRITVKVKATTFRYPTSSTRPLVD
ncbi:uncharacterized protein Dwil_GK16517 [Drosophila willistoni]|uniref:Ionotropic glutamate receptor L-glutamate and glycine-binding domain-containing protein n=1 Tax=Drosophila willistoni TaxID=7260 RepID=B4N2J4_DROWI|nr:uncharacterized protein LOC6644796 [Drosophila willistoni]EDW78583.2 uncharacterized protein Dwil_GK16517 [Drosophila willistoni]